MVVAEAAPAAAAAAAAAAATGSNTTAIVIAVLGLLFAGLLYTMMQEDPLTKKQRETKLQMMQLEAKIKEKELELKKQVLADMQASITAKAVDGVMYRDYDGTGDEQYWVQTFKDKNYGGLGDGRDHKDFRELQIGDEEEIWSQKDLEDYALAGGWKVQSMIINQGVILVFKCVYGPGYADYNIVEKAWDVQKSLDLANDIDRGLYNNTEQSPNMKDAVAEVIEAGKNDVSINPPQKIILRFQTSYQDVSGPGEGRYPCMIFKYTRYRTKLGSLGAADDGLHEENVIYNFGKHICTIDHGYKKYITANSLLGSQLKGGDLVFKNLKTVEPVNILFQNIDWIYNALKIIPKTKVYLKIVEEMYTMKELDVVKTGQATDPTNFFYKPKAGFSKIDSYEYTTDKDEIIVVQHTYANIDEPGADKIPYIIEKRISKVPKVIDQNIPNLRQWVESTKDIEDSEYQWPPGQSGYIRYKPISLLKSSRKYYLELLHEDDQTITEKTYKQQIADDKKARRIVALEKINASREENGLEPFPED